MCYVAQTSDSQIVGYALFYYTYSTWLGKSVFLEDLYVQPVYRNGGIGKKLFLTAAKVTSHILCIMKDKEIIYILGSVFK